MRAAVLSSVVLLLSLAACASGVGGEADAATPPARDLGPRDGAVRDGRVPTDMSGGDLCVGIVCMAFEYCDRGSCRNYGPCTPAGGCAAASDVCRNRYCVPRASDVDGDGVTADTDCDETNAMIAPGVPDTCNGLDDDCSGTPDDGAPRVLCPAGRGECLAGVCGCPPGRFDLDANPDNGCECAGEPADRVGSSCAAPQDLGDIADTPQTQTVSGNALPVGREVWYHFRGVDSADTSCDALHVRVQFLTNPDSSFEFTVFRGACGTLPEGCTDTGYQDFSFSTDFSTGAGSTGECPCTVTPTAGANVCGDETADYYVRVRRVAGVPVTCASYSLELSNGVY